MTASLLISFEDQSKSFANGFEGGMVWERLCAAAKDNVLSFEFGHGLLVCNEALYRLMADQSEYLMITNRYDQDYVFCTFVRKGSNEN